MNSYEQMRVKWVDLHQTISRHRLNFHHVFLRKIEMFINILLECHDMWTFFRLLFEVRKKAGRNRRHVCKWKWKWKNSRKFQQRKITTSLRESWHENLIFIFILFLVWKIASHWNYVKMSSDRKNNATLKLKTSDRKNIISEKSAIVMMKNQQIIESVLCESTL